MIKNLEEAASKVLNEKYDVKNFSVNGNNIKVEVKSNSGKMSWEGYIDFNDDGKFSATNFVGSSKLAVYGSEIKSLLEIE